MAFKYLEVKLSSDIVIDELSSGIIVMIFKINYHKITKVNRIDWLVSDILSNKHLNVRTKSRI